ncbi:MAG: PAS domain-containing protein [Candidatus Omnitrophica bacterium]|nr:PAS domain-containing protein [Candidatus Omnitrophota bacterium]
MKDKFNLSSEAFDYLGIGFYKYCLGKNEGFEFINPSLVKILGYSSRAQLMKKKFVDLFCSVDEKNKFLGAIKKSKRVKFFETSLLKKNNKPIWVAISAFQAKSGTKNEYLEGLVEDISLHKDMEENIALERDMFQGALDNMPDAIYFKDNLNRIVRVNQYYLQGMNKKQEDVTGKTDFDFFPKQQAQQMFEDDNLVLTTGKPIVGKIERTLLANGEWNQVITTKIPVYDRQGKIVGTMGITRDMTAYANLEHSRFKMMMNALVVLGRALEMRDPYTSMHTRNVAVIAGEIAKVLGWDENRLLGMKLAAELHDLGKISIPLDILNKPGKLSDLEYQLIQKHVENCCKLIGDIDFPFSLGQIIEQHHERLDGSGYPHKIKEGDICTEARILAVSDVLESMTSHRPYRAALGKNKAIEELQKGYGNKYDASVVDIVVGLLDKNDGKIFWQSN